MKFLPLHLFHKEVEFGNIEGYDDIKNLLRRVLSSDENYNLLFSGPPASAKTLFLLGILECSKRPRNERRRHKERVRYCQAQ